MAKDKVIGGIISLVGLLLIIVYIIWGPVNLYFGSEGREIPSWLVSLQDMPGFAWQWAVIIPITIVVCLIGLLAVWIGYSMVTTPPPVPLEELEEELEAEEAASKAGGSDK